MSYSLGQRTRATFALTRETCDEPQKCSHCRRSITEGFRDSIGRRFCDRCAHTTLYRQCSACGGYDYAHGIIRYSKDEQLCADCIPRPHKPR